MALKCPACRFENTDDSRFCVECGEKIELRCPGCGKGLPLEAKFCNGCGRRLSEPDDISPPELSLHDKLKRIQCYLPEGLTERILSQKDKIEGERRQVTVMFCDMKGFTQITHRLGPEQTFSLMDQILEVLIHKVHEYGGTVNEIRGDGILALFGAPIAVEDAPQRAIRSFLAIHREMIKLSQKVGAELELPPILLRIGINAGPVVVGAIGNDLLHDLLSYVPGARILLIFTYRPQFVPAWSFKSYHCQISLNRLLRRESLSMVVHLLNTRTLDRKVEILILEKTEGVPFFVEEFVTSLLDLNIITKTEDTYRLAKNLAELSIPSTISDVIMARVDTLKEPAKELLQIGSIIEREFSHRLIERVAGFPEEDLQATLGVLKHSELLIERGVHPKSTYVFRHALTRKDDKRAVDLESLYRYYEDNQVLFNAGLMPMYIGDILMDIDDQHLDEAEGWIQKAIDADRQNGLTLHLGKHYALYAELQIRKGDRQVAKDHLGKAIDVFKECGA